MPEVGHEVYYRVDIAQEEAHQIAVHMANTVTEEKWVNLERLRPMLREQVPWDP